MIKIGNSEESNKSWGYSRFQVTWRMEWRQKSQPSKIPQGFQPPPPTPHPARPPNRAV